MERYSQHSVPNATLMLPAVIADGGSQPRVYDFDDMVIRLVKWQPSAHGLTSAYSELIASRVGQLINAPIARAMVVHIHMALLPPEQRARLAQPFHVGFTYLPGSNFTAQDYARIENTAALPAAALHLAWLQVGDQEGHNQYLNQLEQVLPDNTRRKLNQFSLIDQACLFGSHDWSNAALDQPASPYRMPSHLKAQLSMERLAPVVQQVQSLADCDIRSCFESYPQQWGIDPRLITRAIEYTLKRRDHLADILRANF